MLTNRHRRNLRHPPPARRWASLTTGVVRLPASEIRGGWVAGHYDWYPWQVESFDAAGERATVRSLTDRRVVRTITCRQLEAFEEIAPFGHLQRSRSIPVQPWWKPRKPKHPRFV